MNRRSLLKLPLAALALGILSKSKLLEAPEAESPTIQPMPSVGYAQFPYTISSTGAYAFTYNSPYNTGTFTNSYTINIQGLYNK
jgi:hypothetical protein